MPNTLIPIQTYTLTSSASSITFSNIPQNYTDLKIVISARNASSNAGYERLSILMQLNGSTSTFTNRFLSSSNPPSSFSYSNGTIGWIPASDSTSNTFSNIEVNIFNYAGSTNKSYSVDNFQTNSTADYNEFNISLVGGIWSTTSAITSVGFTFESGSNIVSGSTFTLYGISNGVKATGGTLTVAGGYAYHTFTSTGSFLPNQQIKGAEILAVAGGGGGGWNGGGGGGAGGVLYSAAQTFNAGQGYTALVGAGGTAGILSGSVPAGQGGSSGLIQVFATGGGRGGSSSATDSIRQGGAGGSGGGAAGYGINVSSTTLTTGGTGTVGQGNNGGGGYGNNIAPYGNGDGGGGGGAGTVGGTATNGSPWTGGNGGDGTTSYSSWGAITGTGELVGGLYYYAGGGGGMSLSSGTRPRGGYGGGGQGGVDAGTDSTAGTANTGGGGGASRGNNTDGKAGGSGLIIVRYPLS
jgi:hypothetical protein